MSRSTRWKLLCVLAATVCMPLPGVALAGEPTASVGRRVALSLTDRPCGNPSSPITATDRGSAGGQSAFDGRRAYDLLQRLCALGPRPSGSQAMAAQRQLLARHFSRQGARIVYQRFQTAHPITGAPVGLCNLVARWHPQRTKRLLLAAHYDTRPWPDREPNARDRLQPFVGANDGASGVAVLGELARHIPGLPDRYGIDIVLLDAEEFVFDDRTDPYFVGSTYFARQYRDRPRQWAYQWGLVLDMVGDAQLQIYQERSSTYYALPLVRSLWQIAREQQVPQFIARVHHRVLDDHLPLNEIAGIPTCLIIDFDYPAPDSPISYWHTRHDTPDKCSADSLNAVGRIVLAWLRQAP